MNSSVFTDATPMRHGRLLILDMDEILIYRGIRRPGLDSFLEYIFSNFEVALWCVMPRNGIEGVGRFVFGKYYEQLLFVDGEESFQEFDNYETCRKTGKQWPIPTMGKSLNKIWALPVLKGMYNKSNTLVVDNDHERIHHDCRNCHIYGGRVGPRSRALSDEDTLRPDTAFWVRLSEYVDKTKLLCISLIVVSMNY
jgi:hypothetical protein